MTQAGTPLWDRLNDLKYVSINNSIDLEMAKSPTVMTAMGNIIRDRRQARLLFSTIPSLKFLEMSISVNRDDSLRSVQRCWARGGAESVRAAGKEEVYEADNAFSIFGPAQKRFLVER